MNSLLSAVARTFVRAFVGSLIVFAPGILAAPDLGGMRALALAALLGSIAAGIRAIQAYVPQLTFTHWLGHDNGKYLDSFAHGFLPALLAGAVGLLTDPTQGNWRAIATGVVVGAFTAGIRGLQAALQTGEGITPALGVAEPPAAAPVPAGTNPAAPPKAGS